MTAPQTLSIVDGVYGRRAVATAAWTSEMTEYITRTGITELELNTGKGWPPGHELTFLSKLMHLEALVVLDFGARSANTVHLLGNLRLLSLVTYCDTPIHFSAFPHLEKCNFEWRSGSESLFDCGTLETLTINRYGSSSSAGLGRLTRLRSLALLNATVDSIRELSRLSLLQDMRLGGLRRLASLHGVEGLQELRELTVQQCPRLTSLEPIRNLRALRRLLVTECSRIDSLRPVHGLPCLECVLFYGSTYITDGDLAPLLSLPQLTEVSFQNRRHYSHTRSELLEAIKSRNLHRST